jgi:hypothetical protein
MRRALALAVLTTVVACKSTGAGDGAASAVKADDGAGSACADVQATTGILTGAQTFELSSRCLFNAEGHEIHMKIYGPTFEKVVRDSCNNVDSGYGWVRELWIDGHRIENVGIKGRGNTSNCNEKLQFKLKFNAKKVFEAGSEDKEFAANKDRRVFGLEGVSLRASQNDPTMLREKTSSRLFTALSDLKPTTRRGPLVYRGTFARVFASFMRPESQGPETTFQHLIDGFYYDFKGTYTLTENIDETFLYQRFQAAGEDLEHFYLLQADLARAQTDRAHYTRSGWAAEYADGKEVKNENGKVKAEQKLFELMDRLAEPNVSEARLEELIDVDSMVNYVAGAMLAGHWDSFLSGRNNDFLFFDGQKWQVIVWDLDNSLGANNGIRDQFMSDNIYAPASEKPQALFTTLFAESHPTFRAKLKSRLHDMLAGFYGTSAFNGKVDDAGAQLLGLIRKPLPSNPQCGDGCRRNFENDRINEGVFDQIKGFAASRRSHIGAQTGN